MSILSSLGNRLDGWYNTLTLLGTALDKTSANQFARKSTMSFRQLADLYDGDWLARRAVSAYPDAAFTRPVTFDDPAAKDAWLELNRTTRVPAGVLHQGLVRGLTFGGAAILLGTDGSVPTDTPWGAGETCTWLEVFARDELIPVATSLRTNANEPDLGMAEVFQIVQSALRPRSISLQSAHVHTSRLVWCEGVPCMSEDDIYYRHEGFPPWKSMLDVLADELASYGMSWRAINSMLNESSISVLKMGGLKQMLSGQDQSEIDARFRAMREGRTNLKTTLLDADSGEDFRRDVLSFGGVSDLAIQTALKLCAALNIPPVVLFGQAPAGMNSSGDEVIKLWHEHVERYASVSVLPKVGQIMTAAGYPDANPQLPPMSEPSAKEHAEAQSVTMGVAQALLDMGLVDELALQTMLREGAGVIDFTKLPEGVVEQAPLETPDVGDLEPAVTDAPVVPSGIVISPTGQEKVITVNEAREALGKGTGLPGGDVTIAEFTEARVAKAEVVGREAGKVISGAEDPEDSLGETSSSVDPNDSTEGSERDPGNL